MNCPCCGKKGVIEHSKELKMYLESNGELHACPDESVKRFNTGIPTKEN